jgi:uncharacterized protein YcbX
MRATVSRLGRYPVKSFQGETVEHTAIGTAGMPGDRRWAVVDQATGKALSAKREPRLLDAAARTVDGTVEVALPTGTMAVDDPAVHQAVSAWLDRDVRVEHADADGPPRSYEFNVSSEDEGSPIVDIACPPGTFVDLAAVHVLTTASLRAIAARYPEGQWDLHRFRPGILLDTPDDEGFVEDAWVGGTLTIGGVVLQPFMPTVRCAMVTRAQGELPRDLDIAKTINREHGGSLGIYCAVAEPGQVKLGDTARA